ncbi:MAG TPA: hypothetical protein VF230_06415 [Acidimicrobiales bacterium]
MRQRLLLRASAIGVVGVALVSLAALSTLVLAVTYRPSGGQSWPSLDAGGGGAFTQWWSVTQAVALGAFVFVALLTIAAALTRAPRDGSAPSAASKLVGTAAGAGATLAALAAIATKPLVQWDQLALWKVTAGQDAKGYLFAGFDDSVRFVLVGGTEVSQSSFAAMVVVHLVAPVVAAALFVVALAFLGGRRAVEADHAHAVPPARDYADARSAAPNAELNRSHQITTDR